VGPSRLLGGLLVLGSLLATPVLDATPAGAAAYLGDQWGLSNIGAPSAWATTTGAGVRIGIVDTGVDMSQDDLLGKVVAQTAIVSQPAQGCAQPSSAQDDNGHGTHVAGIATASGAYGVYGVAPGASLVVAKVLDCQGGGTYQDVVSGIQWVVAHGARIVNLSLGDAGTGLVDQSQLTGNQLASALQAAWNAGAIPVVAAGNNSDGLLGLGETNFSNIPAVIVAATGKSNELAWYTNTIDAAKWGVAAPGGDNPNGGAPACGAYDPAEILSTFWTPAHPSDCYASLQGTSMATPFVSGALALLLSRGLSQSQAVQVLLSTANHSVACGSDCSGLVNVAAAVAATTTPPPTGAPGRGTLPPTSAPPRSTGSTGAPVVAGIGGGAPSTTAGSSAPPASSTVPSSSIPHPATRALHGLATPKGGSAGWVALPVVLGLLLLVALAVVGRRMLAVRHAMAAHQQEPLAGDPEDVTS
jgi:subtilisin family serine protease